MREVPIETTTRGTRLHEALDKAGEWIVMIKQISGRVGHELELQHTGVMSEADDINWDGLEREEESVVEAWLAKAEDFLKNLESVLNAYAQLGLVKRQITTTSLTGLPPVIDQAILRLYQFDPSLFIELSDVERHQTYYIGELAGIQAHIQMILSVDEHGRPASTEEDLEHYRERANELLRRGQHEGGLKLVFLKP